MIFLLDLTDYQKKVLTGEVSDDEQSESERGTQTPHMMMMMMQSNDSIANNGMKKKSIPPAKKRRGSPISQKNQRNLNQCNNKRV
jgi:hypothetical protein